MKKYWVIMENIKPEPLNPLSDPPFGQERKEFDTEQEAVDFAESIRKNWDHVYIKNTETNKLIREIYGNDMYIGDKRISLKEEE